MGFHTVPLTVRLIQKRANQLGTGNISKTKF